MKYAINILKYFCSSVAGSVISVVGAEKRQLLPVPVNEKTAAGRCVRPSPWTRKTDT